MDKKRGWGMLGHAPFLCAQARAARHSEQEAEKICFLLDLYTIGGYSNGK
jgi:hypothetical protein